MTVSEKQFMVRFPMVTCTTYLLKQEKNLRFLNEIYAERKMPAAEVGNKLDIPTWAQEMLFDLYRSVIKSDHSHSLELMLQKAFVSNQWKLKHVSLMRDQFIFEFE